MYYPGGSKIADRKLPDSMRQSLKPYLVTACLLYHSFVSCMFRGRRNRNTETGKRNILHIDQSEQFFYQMQRNIEQSERKLSSQKLPQMQKRTFRHETAMPSDAVFPKSEVSSCKLHGNKEQRPCD